MYLSLPIPEYNAAGKKGGPVYLEECIEKFVEEEILDGSNAWYAIVEFIIGTAQDANALGNQLKGSL